KPTVRSHARTSHSLGIKGNTNSVQAAVTSEVVGGVLRGDLDVVDPVVLLDGLALDVQAGGLGGGGGLAHVVVQDGAGHVAVQNSLDSVGQGVNAHQVDVGADGAAGLLDGLQSAQSHGVVVAEHDLDLVAVLCQGVGHVLLGQGLVPVVQVLVQAVDGLAGILQGLDGVLGAVLGVDVLGVALAHDVSNGAVAVDVALGVGLQDQLALVGAGLAGVGAHVAALVGIAVQNGLVGLTVDEDDGDVGGRDGVHDGLGRGGLDRVDDEHVHTLLQEGVDLLGLGGLVVLAVHDGDAVAQLAEVLLQVGAVQGHEVVGELIDADTDGGAAGSSVLRAGLSRGRGSGSGGRCGRCSRAGIAAAAGSQGSSRADNGRSLQKVAARNHFHNSILLHCIQTR